MDDWVRAAEVKVGGGSKLRESSSEELKLRILSIVDSAVIAVALRGKAPILSGGRDLTYVAKALSVRTVW